MSIKRLTRYFLRGVVTVLPVVLTVYLLYLFLTWMESMAYGVLRPFIGGFYVPGLGLVIAIAVTVGVGFMVSKPKVQGLMKLVELPFTNIPVIKSIYSSLKSFADYFTPTTGQKKPQQVVVLRMPGHALEIVGLVTRTSLHGLPQGFLPGQRVAVYLPMGYMIGGYTVFVPLHWVHPIDMTVEEAMRSSLIAWMARTPDPALQPTDSAGPPGFVAPAHNKPEAGPSDSTGPHTF